MNKSVNSPACLPVGLRQAVRRAVSPLLLLVLLRAVLSSPPPRRLLAPPPYTPLLVAERAHVLVRGHLVLIRKEFRLIGLEFRLMRGGPGGRRRGVGRLTGRQCLKPTRGGHSWGPEAAERSVGMLPMPPDSKRLTSVSVRSGWSPGGIYARGSGWPAAGGGKAHRPSVSQADPTRLQVEIRGGRKVRRDAVDAP